jgi:hypothetical protein
MLEPSSCIRRESKKGTKTATRRTLGSSKEEKRREAQVNRAEVEFKKRSNRRGAVEQWSLSKMKESTTDPTDLAQDHLLV